MTILQYISSSSTPSSNAELKVALIAFPFGLSSFSSLNSTFYTSSWTVYEGSPRKKSLVKRRKRTDPSQCEIHDAGETSATSKNETDEVQLQSQSELQFNIPRTVYPKEAGSATLINNLDVASTSADSNSSQTVIHEPASSISDSATKTAACNEFSGREGIEIGQSAGVDSAESLACELASSHAIEVSNRQSHDNMEHTAEKSALYQEAKDNTSSMPRSGITFPAMNRTIHFKSSGHRLMRSLHF